MLFAALLTVVLLASVEAKCRTVADATCVMKTGKARGVLFLTEYDCCDEKCVVIEGHISNLSRGKHAIHIHEFGDLSCGCNNTGPHYNPKHAKHGGPECTEKKHIGDLGNIDADEDGTSDVYIKDCCMLHLSGKHSIIGRGIVVHEGEDDMGMGGTEESKKTGSAGAKVGCCTIGLADMQK